MPRHTTTTRFSTMNARVLSPLEASVANLLVSFSDTLNAKMAVYFEQFQRELAYGNGLGWQRFGFGTEMLYYPHNHKNYPYP